ncbi:hypothetical protein PG993_004124 [Apiospora rasikravindrae]|uniref:Uncharacterized protein n=1 Tax=Apiospora rasikravindrae TaxID=990691 RepID=A0ABR1TBW3_9PEZI
MDMATHVERLSVTTRPHPPRRQFHRQPLPNQALRILFQGILAVLIASLLLVAALGSRRRGVRGFAVAGSRIRPEATGVIVVVLVHMHAVIPMQQGGRDISISSRRRRTVHERIPTTIPTTTAPIGDGRSTAHGGLVALKLDDEPVPVALPVDRLELLLHRPDVRHLEQVGPDLEPPVAPAGPVDVNAADARFVGDGHRGRCSAGVACGRAGPAPDVDELDEEQVVPVGEGGVYILEYRVGAQPVLVRKVVVYV